MDYVTALALNDRINELREQFHWSEEGFRPLAVPAPAADARQGDRAPLVPGPFEEGDCLTGVLPAAICILGSSASFPASFWPVERFQGSSATPASTFRAIGPQR